MSESVHTFGPRRWLRPVSLQELPALQQQAEQDHHALIAPTHVFVKQNEPVGYASIASVPLVLPWFDTRKCQAADSLYFINVMENLSAGFMRSDSHGLICVPVMEGSPFEPYIDKLGYVNAGRATLALKKVN